MKHLVFPTASAAESKALGQRLAHHLQAPIVIALHGDLGAGKTTFTQGIAAGLGIQQRVTSPTFTLVNEYTLENGWRLVHIDSYRLDRGEAEGIGLEEILDDERLSSLNGLTEWQICCPTSELRSSLSLPVKQNPEPLSSAPMVVLQSHRSSHWQHKASATYCQFSVTSK